MQRAFQKDAVDLGTNMITIRVRQGSDTIDFPVYENVIRQSSDFFKKALKGPWRESQERVISLPKFMKDTFALYYQWLLTGKLHSKVRPLAQDKQPDMTKPFLGISRKDNFWIELSELARALRLGYYVLDTDFTDTVCDAATQCTVELQAAGAWLPLGYGLQFFENIPESSPARQLVFDLIAWTVPQPDIARAIETLRGTYPDFVIDVLQAVVTRFRPQGEATSPLDDWETSCKYHCHAEEKPCYREKSKRSTEPAKKRPAPDDGESQAAKRQG